MHRTTSMLVRPDAAIRREPIPRLVARIDSAFPGAKHVPHAGLDNSSDFEIWQYAKQQALTVVSKDKDFLEYASQHGMPPRLIHLTAGNVRVAFVKEVLLANQHLIHRFIDQDKQNVLAL